MSDQFDQAVGYRTDTQTGVLLGTTTLDRDPEDPDRFVEPYGVTTIKPPDVAAQHVAVFTDGVWTTVQDHRGETWFDADAREVPVTTIGDPATFDPPLFSVAPEQPEPPPPVIVVAKFDFWDRMTEDEAAAVEQVVAQQSVKQRRIFETANTFRSDYELWGLLNTLADQLFTPERKAAILAPSA